MNDVTIYVLIDPRDNRVRYVGQTMKKLSVRLNGHIHGTYSPRKGFWFEDMKMSGVKPVIKEVMRVSKDRARTSETRMIRRCLANGCDLVNTGPGTCAKSLDMCEASKHIDFMTPRSLLYALKKDARVRYALFQDSNKYYVDQAVLIEWQETMRRKPGRPADNSTTAE